MHSRSEPVTTLVQDAQEELDAADSLRDIHLKAGIFDAVIRDIVDVWALFSIRTELIQFHRYIPM
jgi:hypothetical protein